MRAAEDPKVVGHVAVRHPTCTPSAAKLDQRAVESGSLPIRIEVTGHCHGSSVRESIASSRACTQSSAP